MAGVDDGALGGSCYRCGYDLRGIADERACPECGLLAERSRRVSDELHNTRPRWLRCISLGADLILIAVMVAVLWPFVFHALWGVIPNSIGPHVGIVVFDLAAFVFLVGVWLLVRPEGYEPADRADRWRRRMLLWAAWIPVIGAGAQTFLVENQLRQRFWLMPAPVAQFPLLQDVALILMTFGMTPLPFLLFLHLRGLALRARSAELAEHCLIVGVGASLSFLLGSVTFVLFTFADDWNLGDSWTLRSDSGIYKLAILGTAASLFLFWALLLFVRFVVAFAQRFTPDAAELEAR